MATTTSRKRDEEEVALGVGRYYESERSDLWGRAERNATTGGMSSLVDPTVKKQVEGTDTTTQTASGTTTSSVSDSGGGSSSGGGAGSSGYGYSPAYDNDQLAYGQANPFALSPGAAALSSMATGVGLGLAGFPSIVGTVGSKLVSGITSEEGINENTIVNAGLDMLLSAVLGPVAGVVKGVGKMTGMYDSNLADILGRSTNSPSIMSNKAVANDLISVALDRNLTDTLEAVNNPNFTRADRAAYLRDLNEGSANVGYDEQGLQSLVNSIMGITDTPEPVSTDNQSITDATGQAGTQVGGGSGSNYDEAGLQALIDSIQNGTYTGSSGADSGSSSSDDSDSYSNPATSYGGW